MPESSGPMELRDLFNMFQNQTPDQQVIQAVQQRGITFKVSDEMVQRMRENKISEDVIKALQAAPVKEAQAATSPYKKEVEQTRGTPDDAFQQSEVISDLAFTP